jgi:hypothetical protein
MGPIGQWLGHLPFKQEKAGRNRLGSLRGRLTGGRRPHKPGNSGSSPLRATKASRAPWPVTDGKARYSSVGCRSTAGRGPVKAAIGVRIPAPERKVHGDVAQLASALSCHGRGYGFESRRHRERIAQIPVVKRRSFQNTNLASRVRILPGILSANLILFGGVSHIRPEGKGKKNKVCFLPGWRSGSASLLQSESGGSIPSLGTAAMV